MQSSAVTGSIDPTPGDMLPGFSAMDIINRKIGCNAPSFSLFATVANYCRQCRQRSM
jgi:hypothetical protein